MDVYGILGKSCGFGDFERIQLFNKPKDEDRPLPFREGIRSIPDRLNLLPDQGSLFRGPISIRQPLADDGFIDRGMLRLSPELKPTIPGMISNEIDGDADKPGV